MALNQTLFETKSLLDKVEVLCVPLLSSFSLFFLPKENVATSMNFNDYPSALYFSTFYYMCLKIVLFSFFLGFLIFMFALSSYNLLFVVSIVLRSFLILYL